MKEEEQEERKTIKTIYEETEFAGAGLRNQIL